MWTEFYVTCPGNEKWLTARFRSRLMHALIQMKNMLSGKMRVEHFFLPDLDIMDEVPRHEREFLYIMFCISQRLFWPGSDECSHWTERYGLTYVISFFDEKLSEVSVYRGIG